MLAFLGDEIDELEDVVEMDAVEKVRRFRMVDELAGEAETAAAKLKINAIRRVGKISASLSPKKDTDDDDDDDADDGGDLL